MKMEMLKMSNVKIENSKNVKKCKKCNKFKNCKCNEIVEKFAIVSTNETIANVQTIENEISIETIVETIETNANIETMSNEYELFLNQNNYEFSKNSIDENEIDYIITGLKKTLYIKIHNNLNISNVATILNNREQIRANCRNILTLKSLKATKSFTNCHVK